jgi:hypothetical protein
MRHAICLHGLVGNIKGKSSEFDVGADKVLELSYYHWIEHIIENNNADVFIHSWNTELSDKINNMFNPKRAVYDKQIKFDIPDYVMGEENRKQAHYSRWYSTKKVAKLKEKYEKENNFKYDMVMVARFDIAWNKSISFDALNPNIMYYGGWDRNGNTKIKDFWFISKSKNIDNFSKLYNNLDEYNIPGNCTINKKLGISNHRLSKYHIDYLNLKTDTILLCQDNIDASKSDYPLIRYKYFGAKK